MRRGQIAALLAVAGLAGMAQGATILMDLGTSSGVTTTDAQSRTWNTLGNQAGDVAPFALVAADNTASGVSVQMSSFGAGATGIGFNDGSDNNAGANPATGMAAARGYPGTATGDSLHGNTSNWNGFVCPGVRMTFTGMSPGQAYDMYFYAYRSGVSDNRETLYTVTGAGAPVTTSLDVAANAAGNVIPVLGTQADGSGVITVDVQAGPNNTNSLKFYYLGVMEINAVVPEPTSIALLGLGSVALLKRRRA